MHGRGCRMSGISTPANADRVARSYSSPARASSRRAGAAMTFSARARDSISCFSRWAIFACASGDCDRSASISSFSEPCAHVRHADRRKGAQFLYIGRRAQGLDLGIDCAGPVEVAYKRICRRGKALMSASLQPGLHFFKAMLDERKQRQLARVRCRSRPRGAEGIANRTRPSA